MVEVSSLDFQKSPSSEARSARQTREVDLQQVYILPGRCTVQVCAKINLGLPQCRNLAPIVFLGSDFFVSFALRQLSVLKVLTPRMSRELTELSSMQTVATLLTNKSQQFWELHVALTLYFTHFIIIINKLHLHKVHFRPQIAGSSRGGRR